MPLDRRSIEKRDFPARLRGYDRAAVDAHLRWIADELEARIGSTADAAAEQVRAVLAAAERSAAEIVARAQADAERIGSAAGRAGDETTARVSAAASGALERIEALRGELSTLLEALGQAPVADAAPATRDADAASVPSPAPGPAAPADDAGARLVALELALSGAPREQADAVIAEQFALGDERAALLDDVYAAAGR
ncbi:MAG TPA: DivIVA domain-containing protein [Conexibacter sp.]|nr:DivIVA domain-containing protein [Conexibacter sp.]